MGAATLAKGRLDDFRAGVVLDDPQSSVTAETGAVLFDAVDALAGAGVKVVEGWPEGIDPVQISESFGFQGGIVRCVPGAW